VKRDIGEICDCGPKVKKDLRNLERELAKLKEESRQMKMMTKQFPPSVKKEKIQVEEARWRMRGRWRWISICVMGSLDTWRGNAHRYKVNLLVISVI
jgi:hypothetical protein